MAGEYAERRNKRLTLQHHFTSHTEPIAVPPIVHQVLNSPGQPLDSATRAFMESHFGHDFSQVRVHTDAKAAESAQAVNALAYTLGRDVVFGTGRYVPATAAGKKILAHELTHVIQQRSDNVRGPIAISSSEDLSEREATHTAEQLVAGGSIQSILQSSGPVLQREDGKKGTTPKEKVKKSPGATIIGEPTQSSYTVKGNTLAEAAAVIDARDEAGLTEWNVNLSYTTDENGIITRVTVTVNLKITMPNWPGAAKLSKAAKAEWDRFYRALEEHEQGHVSLLRERFSGLGESLVGKSEAEAKADFETAKQELQKKSDEYDVETDYGRKRGTIIDTSIK
jgi:predicted secreted Zn-dependent protease